MDPSEVPWRDTMRPVRFYMIDARLLVLLTVWLFLARPGGRRRLSCWRLRRFASPRRGATVFRAGLRALRAASAGRRRALHAARLRRFVDFG